MALGLSIAAISPQWIGIAVASAIVVVLIVILLVRRSKAGKQDVAAPGTAPAAAAALVEAPHDQPGPPYATPPATGGGASFLDQPLEGGFEGLGTPAGAPPALGTVVMPRESRPAAAAPVDPLAPRPAPPVIAPMDMDMGSLSPTISDDDVAATPEAAAPPSDAPGVPAPAVATPESTGAGIADTTEPVSSAVEPTPSTAPPEDADATPAPLSDIIVTTNRAEVDLTDPDVRAMLQELVHDEIALAEVYRTQGQTLDAILQLTEAEKACNALGDAEQAQRIQAMLSELQA
jgi:hypothetical protein